jgi:hypothetical protein
VNTLILCLALATWFGLGYPIARHLGSVSWPALSAPPIGLAIQGFLTPLLYLNNIGVHATTQVCLGLATPGVLLSAWDAFNCRWNRSHGSIPIALLIAFLFVILPKWLGPPDFSVFQGNIGDQFWYLTTAFTTSRFDASTIQDMDSDFIEHGFAGVQLALNMRPSAPLMLAGFASFLHRPLLLTSYAYLASFQLCLFCSSAFVVRNLFSLSPISALSIALAVATGFFSQYVFDINAWSHLASIPIATLMIGLVVLQISPIPNDRRTNIVSAQGIFWSMAACLAGLMYIYPETLPIIGVVTASMLLYQCLNPTRRSYAVPRLVPLVLAGAAALMLCSFAWQMTVGFFFEQARWVTDSSHSSLVTDWWKYSQAYLFGFDNDPNEAVGSPFHKSFFAFLYRLFSLTTSFLSGILGVYFLQPRMYMPVGLLLMAALLLSVVCLTLFWCRSVGSRKKNEYGFDQDLLGGALCGLLMVGALLSLVEFWPSSKGAIPIVPVVRILWKVLLLAFLVFLVALWIRSIFHRSGTFDSRIDRIDRAILDRRGGPNYALAGTLSGNCRHTPGRETKREICKSDCWYLPGHTVDFRRISDIRRYR